MYIITPATHPTTGSWYDPSNPVVPMTGHLRSDLLSWMLAWENEADLCLTLGTSVCGMNSDRMAASTAKKAKTGHALGTVLVGLQQTQMDAETTVRVFATIDRFMAVLMEELRLPLPAMPGPKYKPNVHAAAVPHGYPDDVYLLPYDRYGMRTEAKGKTQPRTRLALRVGDKVKLTIGKHKGDIGEVISRNRDGHYVLIFQHKLKKKSKITHPMQRVLGTWWIAGASRGVFDQLPLVNVEPITLANDKGDDTMAPALPASTNADGLAMTTAAKSCFNIQPLKFCAHLPAVFAAETLLRRNAEGNSCTACDCHVENWICLTCARLGCGRHQHAHAKQHATAVEGHSVCLCLEDLSVWCYKCDSYLDQFAIAALRAPFSVLHETKFGEKPVLPTTTSTTDFCLRLESVDPDDVSTA